MKTLVLGCNGQLGQALADTAPDGIEYMGPDLPDLDITKFDNLLAQCRRAQPAVIINAAAYTAVDQAESEMALAKSVNVDGPRNIAIVSREIGARLIHISTDFVFDGKSSEPYTAEAETKPLNVYGQTKRDGELAVLEETSGTGVVVRTSWLYSATGKNFVKTMLRLMHDRDELSVVSDQIGSPTWADSLAEAVWKFVYAPDLSGIFHWSDTGQTSWYEFALAIQEEALSLGILSKAIPVKAIRTVDYPAAAARPPFSVLDCSATQKALKSQPAQWQDNLRQMLANVKLT